MVKLVVWGWIGENCGLRFLARWGHHPGSTDRQSHWLRFLLNTSARRNSVWQDHHAGFYKPCSLLLHNLISSGQAAYVPLRSPWGETWMGFLGSNLQHWKCCIYTLCSLFPTGATTEPMCMLGKWALGVVFLSVWGRLCGQRLSTALILLTGSFSVYGAEGVASASLPCPRNFIMIPCL